MQLFARSSIQRAKRCALSIKNEDAMIASVIARWYGHVPRLHGVLIAEHPSKQYMSGGHGSSTATQHQRNQEEGPDS